MDRSSEPSVCHLDQNCCRKVKTKIFFSIYNNKLFSFYVAATGSNATVGATDWILPIVYYDYRFVLGRMYGDW